MRAYEFLTNNVYDVEKSSCINLEKMLIESAKFVYEDIQDVKDYKKFIADEKLHTISCESLIVGKTYCPIFYMGAPYQQTIFVDIRPSMSLFVSKTNTSLIFKNKKNFSLPLATTNTVGARDILIFNNITDMEHHLTIMKLKFSDWDIRIRKL